MHILASSNPAARYTASRNGLTQTKSDPFADIQDVALTSSPQADELISAYNQKLHELQAFQVGSHASGLTTTEVAIDPKGNKKVSRVTSFPQTGQEHKRVLREYGTLTPGGDLSWRALDDYRSYYYPRLGHVSSTSQEYRRETDGRGTLEVTQQSDYRSSGFSGDNSSERIVVAHASGAVEKKAVSGPRGIPDVREGFLCPQPANSDDSPVPGSPYPIQGKSPAADAVAANYNALLERAQKFPMGFFTIEGPDSLTVARASRDERSKTVEVEVISKNAGVPNRTETLVLVHGGELSYQSDGQDHTRIAQTYRPLANTPGALQVLDESGSWPSRLLTPDGLLDDLKSRY